MSMCNVNDAIAVVDYDPTWSDRFTALASRIRPVLEGILLRVEHIGSTAVPGLAAKPIIDLDVVVQRATVMEAIRRLGIIGYVHEGDLGIAGREAFLSPAGEPKHHLYVLEEGSLELQRHLDFRDALRADSTLRDRYAALKRSLADQHPHDRAAYTEAKSAFITAVLKPPLIQGMAI
jgi:GrpB-like predicted nucleotidyltransferase (UPF0157 family)